MCVHIYTYTFYIFLTHIQTRAPLNIHIPILQPTTTNQSYKHLSVQAFFEARLPGSLTFPDSPDASSVYVAITTWLCGSITTYSSLNSGAYCMHTCECLHFAVCITNLLSCSHTLICVYMYI